MFIVQFLPRSVSECVSVWTKLFKNNYMDYHQMSNFIAGLIWSISWSYSIGTSSPKTDRTMDASHIHLFSRVGPQWVQRQSAHIKTLPADWVSPVLFIMQVPGKLLTELIHLKGTYSAVFESVECKRECSQIKAVLPFTLNFGLAMELKVLSNRDNHYDQYNGRNNSCDQNINNIIVLIVFIKLSMWAFKDRLIDIGIERDAIK